MNASTAILTKVRKTMTVELIAIPKETVSPEQPATEKKKEEKPIIVEEKSISPAPTVAEKTDYLEHIIPEKNVESILREPQRTFLDLADRGNLLNTGKAVQDTIRMPAWFWQPKPSREQEKKEPVPPEQARDERRAFKTDVFGIPLNGNVALLIHLGRHAVKSAVWKIRDMRKKKSGEKMANSNFIDLTGKELCFMILVWRDGLLNPLTLSRRDRFFLVHTTTDDEIVTNEKYLFHMEKRGLVSSLKVDDALVFRAVFSREEILQSLIEAMGNSLDRPDRQTTISDFIDLIVRCYDDSTGADVIPDGEITPSSH